MPPPVTAMRTMTTRIATMRAKIMRAKIMRMVIRTITAITIIMMSMASTSIITATLMLMTTNKPEPAATSGGMTEREAAALYRLMTWLSPSFPVGAFSYSSGIEWAVEAGDITDAASVRDWLGAMLADGSGFCDGVFLAQAHRAAEAEDEAALRDIAEFAAAFVTSRERQLETSAQGRAFTSVWRSQSCASGALSCGVPPLRSPWYRANASRLTTRRPWLPDGLRRVSSS